MAGLISGWETYQSPDYNFSKNFMGKENPVSISAAGSGYSLPDTKAATGAASAASGGGMSGSGMAGMGSTLMDATGLSQSHTGSAVSGALQGAAMSGGNPIVAGIMGGVGLLSSLGGSSAKSKELAKQAELQGQQIMGSSSARERSRRGALV